LADGIYEHAKWLDGARIERLLGNHLSSSHVVLLPDTTVNDLVIPVLQQKGDYLAVVDPDRTFRGLIDRAAVLESLASEYVRQADSKKI
jgi:CBS-domain-containing membrane protein